MTRHCQRFVVAMVLVALASGVSIAAAPDATNNNSSPERTLKFVFITCAVDQPFFGPVKTGMEDAARMLDVECNFVGTPGVDVPAQAALVRQAIADKVDGIALNIIDPVAFDEVVAEAVSQGIPVVAFNIDDSSTPNKRLATVSQQVYEAGKALAERAARSIPAAAHVLLTKHDEGISALDERQRGIKDVLKAKSIRWTSIITGNDSTEGARVVADALRKHPDIRVVLGSGQSDTEAAGLAIASEFADQGYWAAGFDLSPTTLDLIEQGHIRFTVDQQPYVQGFYPVVQLALLCRYGLAPSNIDAGAVMIDRSNVQSVKRLTAERFR
jgi:simple sugar transport system substrate-binding protein